MPGAYLSGAAIQWNWTDYGNSAAWNTAKIWSSPTDWTGNGNAGGNIVFATKALGAYATDTLTERLRITSGGGVSFGTGGTNYGTSGQVLQSNGNAPPTWVAFSAASLGGLTKSQMWNNSGQSHGTYNSFVTPSDFGEWFIHQDTYTDGPGAINVGGANTGQYYSRSVGLGNDYAYSSYVQQTAIGRNCTQPYHWVRNREGGTWGAWTKMAAGYADTAGSATDSSKLPLAGGTMTGLIIGNTNTGGALSASNDTSAISCRGNASNAASMSFHRPGIFAINLGLDTDNVFKIGGWSASVNAFQMDSVGNLTMLNNVTAYSDERYKTNWKDLPADYIDQLATIKHGIYDRTDVNATQVGVSAQSLQKILEHAVLTSTEGILSVAYGNAAMVSAVELAKRVVELQKIADNQQATIEDQNTRIKRLESMVEQLLNK